MTKAIARLTWLVPCVCIPFLFSQGFLGDTESGRDEQDAVLFKRPKVYCKQNLHEMLGHHMTGKMQLLQAGRREVDNQALS